MKGKIIKLVEKNIREYSHKLGIGEDFFLSERKKH